MPQINYDAMTDTLSVSRNGEQHHTVCPAVHDSHILLSLTAENECIAVEVMGAKAIVPERWWTHPDRSEIPLDLLTEIDMWVRIPLVWAELPLLTSIFEPESLVLGDHPLSWKEEIADAQFKHIYNTVPANTRVATGDDAQYAIRGCEHGVLDCCWTLSLFLEHEKTSPKCQRLREVYKDTLLPRLRAAYLYLALSGGPQTIMSASDDFVQFFLSSSSKGDQNPIEIKRSFLETYMETQVGRSRP